MVGRWLLIWVQWWFNGGAETAQKTTVSVWRQLRSILQKRIDRTIRCICSTNLALYLEEFSSRCWETSWQWHQGSTGGVGDLNHTSMHSCVPNRNRNVGGVAVMAASHGGRVREVVSDDCEMMVIRNGLFMEVNLGETVVKWWLNSGWRVADDGEMAVKWWLNDGWNGV